MIYELAVKRQTFQASGKVLQIVLSNPFTSPSYQFLELNATLPLLSLHTHALTQNLISVL